MMNDNFIKIQSALINEALPACVIDLDAFDRNCKKLLMFLKNKNQTIRIASKSLRTPDLIKRVLKSNEAFKGLMIFSANELNLIEEFGTNDFLIAYPTVQKSDLEQIEKALQRNCSVKLVVDHPKQIEIINEYFENKMSTHENKLQLVIDVDASLNLFGIHLGVRRSPVRSITHALELARLIQKKQNVKFAGLMMYEAQVAGLTDRNPFKKLLNPIAHLVRMKSMKYVQKFRKDLYEAFQNEKIPLIVFNGGGTGSFNFANEEDCLTELTAGSALFSSHLFDYYSNIQFEPACFFALQVVRTSDRNYVTCQGGGYIASGEPGWDRLPKPIFPEGLSLVSSEGTGEVQTPLQLKNASLNIGDVVLFRHSKSGEVMERFNEVLIYSNGKIIDRVKTYRGLGLQTF